MQVRILAVSRWIEHGTGWPIRTFRPNHPPLQGPRPLPANAARPAEAGAGPVSFRARSSPCAWRELRAHLFRAAGGDLRQGTPEEDI